MKNKGTLILVSAVVASVGYAVYDFQSEKKAEVVKIEQSHLVKVEKDQINQVTIHSVKGEDIIIDRSAEGWQIRSPLQESADQSAAQDFLDASMLETSHETVKDGGEIDWKVFGLDNPVGSVAFRINSGKTFKLLISSKKNYSGDCYVRLDGESKVYLASATWLNRIEKSAFDFRDKRLMKKSAAGIRSFKVIRGKSQFTVLKDNNAWALPDEPKWKLDQTRASEMIYLVNTVKAAEFTKEGPVTGAELKHFGLDKPEFTVEIELKDKITWKALFARPSKSESYVQTFDPPRILKVSNLDMDKFAKVDKEAFRDRHEPFDFDKTHIKKIHVVNGDLKVDFAEKSNDDWIVENEDKTLDYQKDRPKAILALVRNLEIADFSPPQSEAAEVDKTHSSKTEFLDEGGKPVFAAQFLGTYKKTVDNIKKSMVLVKTSQYPQPVGVDEGTYRSIGLDSVVYKKIGPQ